MLGDVEGLAIARLDAAVATDPVAAFRAKVRLRDREEGTGADLKKSVDSVLESAWPRTTI